MEKTNVPLRDTLEHVERPPGVALAGICLTEVESQSVVFLLSAELEKKEKKGAVCKEREKKKEEEKER